MKKNKFFDAVLGNIYDPKDKTIRGSFISQLLTLFMVYVIFRAIDSTEVMERVSKLSEVILGFYFLSLGIWKTGQVIKYRADKCLENKDG